MFKRIKIRKFEMGLRFHDGEFHSLMEPGRYLICNPRCRVRVDIVCQRAPWIENDQLDLIAASGALKGRANFLDLNDHQRALVWIDGRFHGILGPGLYGYWTGFRNVRIEIADTRSVQFQHDEFETIIRSVTANTHLELFEIAAECRGALYIDRKFARIVESGHYAFWKSTANVQLVEIDLREQTIDISGQEIMTADKVTLRMNAVATYRVTDLEKLMKGCADFRTNVYREIQLALRTIVGACQLDDLLVNKDDKMGELEREVRNRTSKFGLEILSIGIRDVILPGEMKELMNRVTEAKKAAEANLIVRREETAAMRSQANTAKLLADNPTLMRLRELELLEKFAASGNLNVVLGEKGLADRVVNLL